MTDPITPDIKEDIDSVIMNDEGGWVLSSDPDDGDGGWTYAGVTSKVYMGFVYPNTTRTKAEMQAVIMSMKDKVDDNIYQIYYGNYYLPMINILGSDLPYDYELSCIINCGVGGFTEIYDIAKIYDIANGPNEDYKTEFLAAWKQHYLDIISANPSKAIYENGWMARVDRYANA